MLSKYSVDFTGGANHRLQIRLLINALYYSAYLEARTTRFGRIVYNQSADGASLVRRLNF